MNPAEKKITKGLDHAVSQKRAGKTPTEAAILGAKFAELNPDMTERLVEAFNIALSNSGIRKAQDKTASFPLANKEEVIAKTFGDLVPAKNEKSASSSPEEFLFIGRRNVELGWKLPSEQKSAELDRPVIEQAYGACDLAVSGLSKLAQDLVKLELEMGDSFSAICSHFSLSENCGQKFAELEHRVVAELGEPYVPFMTNIYEAAGLDRRKIARFSGEADVGAYFPDTEEWRLLCDLQTKTAAFIEAAENHKLAEIETQKSIRETQDLVGELNAPFSLKKQKCASDLLSKGASLDKIAKEGGDESKPGKSSGPVIPAINKVFDSKNNLVTSAQSGTASAISDEYQKAYLEDQKRHFTGPKDEVNAEMDNVRRSTILQEIMANDEIVGRMSPSDIQHSYQSLLSLAPALTLDHDLVRGWLRNASASQALDPFAAGSLVKVQGDIAKTKAIEKGLIKPT